MKELQKSQKKNDDWKQSYNDLYKESQQLREENDDLKRQARHLKKRRIYDDTVAF